MTSWPIYTGAGDPHDGIEDLPAPPSWRTFKGGATLLDTPADDDPGRSRKLGDSQVRPVPSQREIQMINAALFLRRPLLVTGRPGTGKSSLAYEVAKELKLGPVLRWPITSRSTLQDGLYRYDAIGRLQEENLNQLRRSGSADRRGADAASGHAATDIGRHIRLGPLGTALLPYRKPRVLLIDEVDKGDFDLPNDLLNVFEEGEFEIEELARLPRETRVVPVMTGDRDTVVDIERGQVRCAAFPFVVMTSNGERDFPRAFLRRCLRLNLLPPDEARLRAIVAAHLGTEAAADAEERIGRFLSLQSRSEVTTDQLLNAVYLATSGARANGNETGDDLAFEDVITAVLQPLTELSPGD